MDETFSFIDWPSTGLLTEPRLDAIAAQAEAADRSRTVSGEVIAHINAHRDRVSEQIERCLNRGSIPCLRAVAP